MCEKDEIEPIIELNFGEGPSMWEMIEQIRKQMTEALMLPKSFFQSKDKEKNND